MSTRSNRRGFAILTVVFVMVVFAILGIAAVALITGSAQMMTDEYRSQQAFDVAEAGVAYMAEQLENDNDWSDNTGVTVNFGPGSFTITYLHKTATTATIRSDGAVEGITRSVKQEFSSGGGTPKAFKTVFYTEQRVTVGGSSSGDIYGPVSAGSEVNSASGIVFHGEVEANNTSASLPTPNWGHWQTVADRTISGNYTFTAGTYSGIYYITGNVTFRSGVTINGTIISRGRVTANNQSNISVIAAVPNPAIFAADRITFSGITGLALRGWVMSQAEVRFTGNANVTGVGGIASKGDIIFTGNSNVGITYDDAYAPAALGYTGGETEEGVDYVLWEETF